MGGQKFQYDESGGTFFYFILSFLALILIPATYYWWPRNQKEDPSKQEKECRCNECKKKESVLRENEPWKGTKELLIKLAIISGWLFLIFLGYKVSQLDYEYANFDPYEILGVPFGSTEGQIKKAYRKLSLVLHPDKETGDEKAFMKLTKAYQALTDEEARKNWERYGNPDGPGAMSFGIALPSWIVEKENSVWVLGLYALVFMVALPTVVGMWWYRSIRYSNDQVLLDTTQLYYYFINKTPSMALKRAIMVLGSSLEFEKKYNSEIVERPSDNDEVPQLIKQLPYLNEKNREIPLSYTYSIKARALIHAHLSRLPLNPLTLDRDRMYVVKKCPYLIAEMVNCVAQLIMLAYARRISRLPTIETIENCMKLCPMIVQALWEYKSPLLQLPHIGEEHLKHFMSKKRHVKTIQQFVQLKAEDRRSILRFLDDQQYEDVMKVCGKMPLIDVEVRSEVIDDEPTTVYTAGAIITVTVTLDRRELKVLFGDELAKDHHIIKEEERKEAPEGEEEEGGDGDKSKSKVKAPVWLKRSKKQPKKGGNKKSSKGKQQSAVQNKEQKQVAQSASAVKDEKKVSKKSTSAVAKTKKNDKSSGEESSDEDSDAPSDGDRSDDEDSQGNRKDSGEDDDDDWEKYQSGIEKRNRSLEGKSKQSHAVHCPYFPEVKQEYWWVYVSDRKSRTLLSGPVHVTDLIDRKQIQLKFTAPRWPGTYTFSVCFRSDSYLGFDQMHDIKLDVQEAPEVPVDHPQWENFGEEEEGVQEGAPSDVSEFTTDEDVDDDE